MEDKVSTVLQYVDSLMGLELISFLEILLSQQCMQVRDGGECLLEIERERIDEKISEMDDRDVVDLFIKTAGNGCSLEELLSDMHDDHLYDLDDNYYTKREAQIEKRAGELLQEYETRNYKQSIKMAYEHKEGQGSLFRNEKQNERQPDLKGTILIGGVTYRLVGWEKSSHSGAGFISLQAEPLK